jgi:hypothetical protein
MAVGADCGASTVLEESRVARTVGSLVPGACRVENSKFEFRIVRLRLPKVVV